MQMGVGTCRCGAVWRQRGNRTGHCSECHETFEGITAFDRHQQMLEAAPWQRCLDPVDVTNKAGDPAYELANPMVAGPVSPYTWSLRISEEAREKLKCLGKQALPSSPVGDCLDTPAEAVHGGAL